MGFFLGYAIKRPKISHAFTIKPVACPGSANAKMKPFLRFRSYRPLCFGYKNAPHTNKNQAKRPKTPEGTYASSPPSEPRKFSRGVSTNQKIPTNLLAGESTNLKVPVRQNGPITASLPFWYYSNDSPSPNSKRFSPAAWMHFPGGDDNRAYRQRSLHERGNWYIIRLKVHHKLLIIVQLVDICYDAATSVAQAPPKEWEGEEGRGGGYYESD